MHKQNMGRTQLPEFELLLIIPTPHWRKARGPHRARQTLRSEVDEYNAVRMKLTAEMADSANLVKAESVELGLRAGN